MAVRVPVPQVGRGKRLAMNEPTKTQPQTTPYEYMGGEPAVRRLAEAFYDIMERDPAYTALRALHAADLAPMRARLFEFLSGWLGGPRLYRGCVMSAHAPIAIGSVERDQWLACMERAMADAEVPEAVRMLVGPVLARMANAMRKS